MKLSVVIPVYNEEAVIGTTHETLSGLLRRMVEAGTIDAYEIVFVDDGSKDGTLGILRGLAEASKTVKVISFSRNYGHQPALAAGLLHSSGDAVVSLDADLQDPPELIEEMIGKFREGNDIVYAVRRTRSTDTIFKRWTARFFYKLMRSMGVDIIYDHADYRLISRKVVEEFRRFPEVNIFLRGIFHVRGFRHVIVSFDRRERFAGETKYPLRKMLSFAWEGMTSFSRKPLRIASATGFFISLLSGILIIWAFSAWMTGDVMPGWASTVIPLLLIGGLNIFFLGLIGEYIGKIYMEVKRRPLFIVSERCNFGEEGMEGRDVKERERSGR
jgi:glycosyltransferase involved in cell wall biosynthesis